MLVSLSSSNQAPRPISGAGHGAFDIVGDVHGQADALFALLTSAGWVIAPHDLSGSAPIFAYHPQGRRLIFTGDLVNKGPDSLRVLRLFDGMSRTGAALGVMGNHDHMLLKALNRAHRKAAARKSVKKVRKANRDARKAAVVKALPDPGLTRSVARTRIAIERQGPAYTARVIALLASMPHQLHLPVPQGHALAGDGLLTIVHAAIAPGDLGSTKRGAIRRAVYGILPGDKKGARYGDWRQHHTGPRWIVHGHTPCPTPLRYGQVICIDTGAGRDEALTLLRSDTAEMLLQAVVTPPARALARAA